MLFDKVGKETARFLDKVLHVGSHGAEVRAEQQVKVQCAQRQPQEEVGRRQHHTPDGNLPEPLLPLGPQPLHVAAVSYVYINCDRRCRHDDSGQQLSLQG